MIYYFRETHQKRQLQQSCHIVKHGACYQNLYMSVCPSVCHTSGLHLNYSRYRNILCTIQQTDISSFLRPNSAAQYLGVQSNIGCWSSLLADNGNVDPCGAVVTDLCFNVPQTFDKQHNGQEHNALVSMHLSDDIVLHRLYTSSPGLQSLVSATPVASSNTTHINFINYSNPLQITIHLIRNQRR